MNLTARLRRAFDTSARFYDYAELTAPPAADGIKGDWAVCYGTGSPTYFGPKTTDTTWPAGAANPGPAGSAGPSIAPWVTGTAYSVNTVLAALGALYLVTANYTSGASVRADIAASKLVQVNAPNGGRVETLDGALMAGFGAYPVALRAYYYRVQAAGVISKLDVEIGLQSGNILAAVYANNGSQGRAAAPAAGGQLASTGSLACPAVGFSQLSLGSTIGLAAGDWIMLAADNTTMKFRTAAGYAGASGVATGRVGYESLGSLVAPTNPNPTVWAPNYMPWVGGE